MITVAEYARKEGVSVQTIYRRLNKINAEGLTVKKNGILYITDEGTTALTPAVEHVEHPVKEEISPPEKAEKAREYNDVLIPFLREQCDFLREELSREREHSRGQATKLAELSEQITELVRNNQILIAAEQNRNNMALLDFDNNTDVKHNVIDDIVIEVTPPPRRGFLARLFNTGERRGV
jgi:DNA-binding transcriptional MocR family regulator